MKTHSMLIASMLLVAACDDNAASPTPADRSAVTSAQAEKDKAQAAKNEADKKLADAKKKVDEADKKLDAAKDKLDDATDKLGADWKGPDRDSWNKTWTGFASGKDKTVDSGDWTIERGKDGEYTAWRKTKEKAAEAGDKVTDAAVLTAVKTKLAFDADIKARNIDVDVKNNVVDLKGTVASPEQAGEAVRIALGTAGVDKVVSHLTWATPKM